MNYKETLYFIGKCLTINHEEKNKTLVLKKIKQEDVNWDNVVKISTSHYVFPALYKNLERANLLNFIPKDLITYMQHITSLNRDRNLKIIAQAKEINLVLLQHKITPVFLKGTGNVLEGLYDSISERMVGDIDIIVPKKDVIPTKNILLSEGYKTLSENFSEHRHLGRLVHKNKIAAVEIHKKLTKEEYANEFNYKKIESAIQKINGFTVLSYQDQLSLSMIAYQLNDYGKLYNSVSLRNTYDTFLLSKKANSLEVLAKFTNLKQDLNNFLAASALVLNQPSSINYLEDTVTRSYKDRFIWLLENDVSREKHYHSIHRKRIWQSRFTILKKAIISKEHRNWFLKRILDKDWQNNKLVAFGLKSKPKS